MTNQGEVTVMGKRNDFPCLPMGSSCLGCRAPDPGGLMVCRAGHTQAGVRIHQLPHGTVGFWVSKGTCPRGQGTFWFLKSHPSVRVSVILFANLLNFQDDMFPIDFSHLLMNSVKHLLVTLSGLMVVITLHD